MTRPNSIMGSNSRSCVFAGTSNKRTVLMIKVRLDAGLN